MNKLRHIIILSAILLFSRALAEHSYQFHLQGPGGKTYTQNSFPGKHILLAFGFTHCPDVCPTTLYNMKLVLNKLKNPEKLQAIFITIDPKRDDVDSLKQYTNYFSPHILGLSGSREAIDEAVENFNATYGYQLDGKKLDPDKLPDAYYTVYHSTYLYLLDDQGHLVDIFDYQSSADDMVSGIEAAIAEKRP